ncbi:MAG: PEGA domain-containing protein [Planctomycetes bacterium]|nr:PEGA domain-containing protein [Planctomycetota bacterium]
MSARLVVVMVLVAGLPLCTGCTGRVARSITIETQPPGAVVWLNDNEVGRTPVTAPFTWYGVYSIRMELEGYEPLVVNERVAAPWYQWMFIDLPFETVVPGTRYDRHHFGPYQLEPAKAADPEELLLRSKQFRSEAQEGLPAE